MVPRPLTPAAALLLALSAPAAAQDPPAGAGPLPGEPEAVAFGRVPPPGVPYLAGFDALHYDVRLQLQPTGTRIQGDAEAVLLVTAPPPDSLRLDLTGLRVDRVSVALGGGGGGAPAPAGYRQDDGRLWVALPAGTSAGDTLRVGVRYGGEPDDGLILRANVHGTPTAFADNWPDRARFWFPAVDHPSDKATVAFTVRHPPAWRVVANGRQVVPGVPATGDGWVETTYRLDVPLPTYLMVVGAAPFAVREVAACAPGGVTSLRPDGCVEVSVWTFPEDTANAAPSFARAGAMVAYYSRLVAPFPYAKLAHVQSATRFGGMENAGAIFYSEGALAAGRDIEGTVAHETAHQWFGDAVTEADWRHLWLSEGFATYFGALYFEEADGVDAFRQRVRQSWQGYLGSDVHNLPLVDTLAVPDDNLMSLLNANSYNKGGAVLHMLRGLLGDEAFFTGIRAYYGERVHGTALTEDLRRNLAATAAASPPGGGESVGDLRWFFDQWVYAPGHPVLDADWRWDAGAGRVTVTLEQVQPAAWPTFRFPLELGFATPAGPVRRRVWVESRSTRVTLDLPAAPSALVLDPDGWLLHTVPPERTP